MIGAGGYSYQNQPYVTDLLNIPMPKAGEIQHVMVEHDDWCPLLLGKGLCVCRPQIRKMNRAERRRMGIKD